MANAIGFNLSDKSSGISFMLGLPFFQHKEKDVYITQYDLTKDQLGQDPDLRKLNMALLFVPRKKRSMKISMDLIDQEDLVNDCINKLLL